MAGLLFFKYIDLNTLIYFLKQKGISRSASVIVSYLMKENNLNLE